VDDDSKQQKKYNGKTTLIFNGTILSSNEIFIHTPSIFYDALQHSSKHSFIKEIPIYQYLEFHHKRQIRFHYLDGIHQKSGRIGYEPGSLQLTMDHPIHSLFTYFLVQKGNWFFFLTYPPNNKIKKRKKDLALVHADTKDYE
jgi:hypothetical protein